MFFLRASLFSNGMLRESTAMKHSATIYDFVRPDHRLSDDWPVFELMNRRLVTGVMEELGSRFRFDASGEAVKSRRIHQSELHDLLESDTVICELSLSPLPGVALFCVPPSVVPALVDVWFGGVGDVTKRPDDAPVVDFSRTERRALDLLVEALCTALTDVWSDLESISPALLRCSKREQLAERKPSEIIVDCQIKMNIGRCEATSHLIYAAGMLEPYAEKLSSVDASLPVRDQVFEAGLREGLLDCELEVHGVLAETRLSLRQVRALRVGDFIPLRDVETVSFRTGVKPLFDARVGQTNGRVSASLSRWHLPERD
jgi:flagellar motor switch protein FliM